MTESIFPAILPWILPPLLGAVIGYITNALAIKMLFRPLEEKRFLGVRIPMTPGIIPKQRYALAENIGEMVSQELITEDALQSQIASAEFQEGIYRNVSSLTEDILGTPISALSEEKYPLAYETLKDLLSGMLNQLFSSEKFVDSVRSLLSQVVGRLFRRSGR